MPEKEITTRRHFPDRDAGQSRLIQKESNLPFDLLSNFSGALLDLDDRIGDIVHI